MKYVELEKGHEICRTGKGPEICRTGKGHEICRAGRVDESEGLVLLKDEGTG